jgi:sugar phosphate isomerase/epimerase
MEAECYMRPISISTCFDYAIPIEAQLPLIKQAGYTYVSIGGNYEHSGILDDSRRAALKARLMGCGLAVDTIHGYDMDKTDAVEVNQIIASAAAELKAPIIVLHCSSFDFDPPEQNSRRKDILEKLPAFEKMARESGVRFALENVLPGTATDFMEEIFNEANPEYFGFCYDSSHDQIGGPRSFALLERLSDRLMAVHISDRIKEFVDHVIPGEGFIDYTALCPLLNRARIKFRLLLEIMTAHSRHKDPEGFLAVSYQEAAKLYDRIF